MSVIHAEKERRLEARNLVYLVLLFLALLVLFFRLWFLQVVQAQALTERAEVLRTSSVQRLAPRGMIVDRKGRLMAGVQQQIVVTAVPAVIKKNPMVLKRLAEMLRVPVLKLQQKLKKDGWRPYLPTPIYVGTSMDVATKIAESGSAMPGLSVESQPMRYYPDTIDPAHVLGYVWTPSAKDFERLDQLNLRPADYVGKLGIEYKYEPQLMGTPGKEQMEIDAKGRPLRSIESIKPRPGSKLVLGLDLDLQKYAMATLKGRKGAAVALDPSTGEVLAMVSSPSYDLQSFIGGISQDELDRIQTDPNLPQINRATSAMYAPGSTFKIVTSIAGMLTGKLDPNRFVHCNHYYQVGKRKFACLGNHGDISYERAFAKSCNVYFYDLGMRVGPDGLREACAQTGLGQKTGIDLLGESRGLVPTREWIEKWRKPPKWYDGDTCNFSIGQGEVHFTPLQAACLAALVANRGTSYRPHLVRSIVTSDKGKSILNDVKADVLGHVDGPDWFWNDLTDAMQMVVDEGTATKARIESLSWCGKTGSAENKKNHETHSWFVGFAPRNNPKIAIAVVVENAGHGGDVAAPYASMIVKHYLKPAQSTTNVRATSTTASALSGAPVAR